VSALPLEENVLNFATVVFAITMKNINAKEIKK